MLASLLGQGSAQAQPQGQSQSSSQSSALPALRYLVSEAWAPPLGDGPPDARGHREPGMMMLWGAALAAELGRPLQTVRRPRLRLESSLFQGETDLTCHAHPAWFSAKGQQQLQWPRQPYMEEVQSLVAGPGKPLPTRLTELRGVEVGMILGYHYPGLETALRSGNVRRRDVVFSAQLPEMLLRGRFDYAVMEARQLAFLHQRQPETRALRVSDVEIERVSLFCALAPQARLTLAEFERAQARLIEGKQFERIAQGFR